VINHGAIGEASAAIIVPIGAMRRPTLVSSTSRVKTLLNPAKVLAKGWCRVSLRRSRVRIDVLSKDRRECRIVLVTERFRYRWRRDVRDESASAVSCDWAAGRPMRVLATEAAPALGPFAVTTPVTPNGNGSPLPSLSACAATVIRVSAAKADNRVILIVRLLFGAFDQSESFRLEPNTAPSVQQPGVAVVLTAGGAVLFKQEHVARVESTGPTQQSANLLRQNGLALASWETRRIERTRLRWTGWSRRNSAGKRRRS